jgi:hypothetical protein
MSLRGQWIARYSGSNTGTVVIDIDELDDHFAGAAIAWDDNAAHPNSFVQIQTQDKSDTQQLKNVPITYMDRFGNILSRDAIQQVIASGVIMPPTADIELQLAGNTLSIKWATPIGTAGSAVATASKTREGLPSDLQPTAGKGWESFKKRVNALEQKKYIYRGQENNTWRLRTAFHRTGRADLSRYARDDISDLNKTFSALTPHAFNLADAIQHAAFIHLAQHHGYPTPLLDWTWSPYVAAFFAFRKIKKNEKGRKQVRIFKLDAFEWNKLIRADKIFGFPPNASIINPLAFGNARAIPQQSISIVSNVDDIESHIESIERAQNKKYLEVFDLPARDRDYVMKELALMGITAGALFPGLDGACESLREWNF